jgi:hypothetical protein
VPTLLPEAAQYISGRDDIFPRSAGDAPGHTGDAERKATIMFLLF